MDVNFKLKQKAKGFNDALLLNGLVYMVTDEKLQDHLTHCSKTNQIAEVCLNCDCSYLSNICISNCSIRSTLVVQRSTPLVRHTQSTPRDTPLPVLVGWIVHDMVSRDRTALLICSEVNGKKSSVVLL